MAFLPDTFKSAHTFYFWKGRVALYTILKAMGVGEGDEVILPGFTCVVVANAVIYLGAKPVYADIDPATYNVTADTIAPHITSRTRVILAQNTFGLSPDLDPIMHLAKEHGIYVVEDCAHGLGGTYKGKPAGTVAHASFFSTQWSKPISTGLGGVAYVRDEALSRRVRDLAEMYPSPSLTEEMMLMAQNIVRPVADVSLLYYAAVDVYRFLTQRLGISVGSSAGDEIQGTAFPAGYLKKMGRYQQRGWRRGLERLESVVRQRQETALYYDGVLREMDIAIPYRPAYAVHTMLRYPVRVPDKEAFLEKARRLRIPVGDWFVSPLHPVEGDLTPWGFYPGMCPEAERACRHVVNLYTERRLATGDLERLFT